MPDFSLKNKFHIMSKEELLDAEETIVKTLNEYYPDKLITNMRDIQSRDSHFYKLICDFCYYNYVDVKPRDYVLYLGYNLLSVSQDSYIKADVNKFKQLSINDKQAILDKRMFKFAENNIIENISTIKNNDKLLYLMLRVFAKEQGVSSKLYLSSRGFLAPKNIIFDTKSILYILQEYSINKNDLAKALDVSYRSLLQHLRIKNSLFLESWKKDSLSPDYVSYVANMIKTNNYEYHNNNIHIKILTHKIYNENIAILIRDGYAVNYTIYHLDDLYELINI